MTEYKSPSQKQNQVYEKQAVAKKIKHFLKLRKQQDILLKDVKTEHISALYKYMREKYRNPKQIKKNGGHLSDFSLMLFGQTVNAMFNKAVREQIIPYNPVGGLDSNERFHIPDTHREFLTIDELERFLAVEPATEPERIVQKAFGFASMTGLSDSKTSSTACRNSGSEAFFCFTFASTSSTYPIFNLLIRI